MSFDTNLPGDLTDDDRLFNVDRGSWELNTRMDWTFLREYRYIAGFERAAQSSCGPSTASTAAA